MQAFIPDVIQAHFDEAAYLFTEFLVEINSEQPNKVYLKKVNARLDAHLDGLLVNFDAAWSICDEALSVDSPDSPFDYPSEFSASEFFIASFLAFHSQDFEKVKPVVESAESQPSILNAVAYGLTWLPWQQSSFWATKFVTSSRPAIAAIGLFCHQTYKQPAPITSYDLVVKSLGQGPESVIPIALLMVEKTQDVSVLPLLQRYHSDELSLIQLKVLESRIKLGDLSAVVSLRGFVLNENDYQERALKLAFSKLDSNDAKQWIAALQSGFKNAPEAMSSEDAQSGRLVLLAIGAMREKPLLPWVVKQMHIPELARIAGRVFSQITGFDLRKQGWVITDGSMDEYWLSLEGDEELDWPDAVKIEQGMQF